MGIEPIEPRLDPWGADYGLQLLPQHAERLRASGISVAVAEARGYRSIETKADLERRGFGRAQRIVPTLLIPIWNVAGDCALYQHRPDEPRIHDGKAIKYQTASGARMVLDVPPPIRHLLGDPSVPLFITEGSRKADAAVTVDLCCIALLGVWNWRGTNEHGGKTALADFESIALNGRKVYIAFDSDVMTKREVHQALARLKNLLEGRGATVFPIYLPAGEYGVKVGLDDFLADGHGVNDLLKLATRELLNLRRSQDALDIPYRSTPSGLVWDKPTRDGPVPVPLTNFTAHFSASVVEDDGADERQLFEIEARLGERVRRFPVPATQFASMNWAVEQLGVGAVIYPGSAARDHARVAIQLLSKNVAERRVYTHTGWREVGGSWCFLHAGGAIGPLGPLPNVETRLEGALARYRLPLPPTGPDLVAAVRASLRILDVAPDSITVPLHAGVYRAACGATDLSIHVSGPTGAGKTELATLDQQHYGADMDARHLPGSWSSTGNALEGLAFAAKDTVLLVDDFAPTGSTSDVQRYHREADRLLRAQGNNSGRLRMRADATLKVAKPPRGLIVSTGEDVPRGQSLRARTLTLEVGPNDVDWELLTHRQRDAAEGLYAQAMAGFVQWLAPRYAEVKQRMRSEVTHLRQHAIGSARHRRTPDIVANLAVGFRYFLAFAQETDAVTWEEAERLWARGWTALGRAAEAQAQYQAASEPTGRFLQLLSAAVASGRAHIAAIDGSEPSTAEAWGWREATVGSGSYERQEWRPHGARVGWLDGRSLYLELDAAYAAAQRLGQEVGDPLVVQPQTLAKRMRERGLLVSVEQRGGKDRLKVRRDIEGARRYVLHLPAAAFSSDEKSGPCGPQAEDGERIVSDSPSSGPLLRATNAEGQPKVAQEVAQLVSAKGGPGPLGPLMESRKGDDEEWVTEEW